MSSECRGRQRQALAATAVHMERRNWGGWVGRAHEEVPCVGHSGWLDGRVQHSTTVQTQCVDHTAPLQEMRLPVLVE